MYAIYLILSSMLNTNGARMCMGMEDEGSG